MSDKKWYGQIITDCEGPEQGVKERVFASKELAEAYCMGVTDGIDQADPECDSLFGYVSEHALIDPDAPSEGDQP